MTIDRVCEILAADHIVPGTIVVDVGGRLRTSNVLKNAQIPDYVLGLHANGCESSVEVVIYSDAEVGCRSIIFQQQKPVFVSQVVPSYVNNWIRIGDYECKDLTSLTPINVDYAYHLLNVMYHAYGHFITEMMAKLFVIKDLYDKGFRFPIILIDTTPEYVTSFIEIILPEAIIINFNPETHYIKCKTLIGISPYQNTILNISIQSKIWALASSYQNTRKKKIFIRRRPRKDDFRNFINEEEIYKCAVNLGFEPLYPGEMTLGEQIGCFWGAEFVIGEFGSALHNTIFSPPDTKVISLNIGNVVQSSIALACGHRLGYIVGQDGKIRLSPTIKAEREGQSDFEISRDQFISIVEANL